MGDFRWDIQLLNTIQKSNLQKVCKRSALNVPAINSRCRYRTLVFHTVSHSAWLAVQLSAHEYLL